MTKQNLDPTDPTEAKQLLASVLGALQLTLADHQTLLKALDTLAAASEHRAATLYTLSDDYPTVDMNHDKAN